MTLCMCGGPHDSSAVDSLTVLREQGTSNQSKRSSRVVKDGSGPFVLFSMYFSQCVHHTCVGSPGQALHIQQQNLKRSKARDFSTGYRKTAGLSWFYISYSVLTELI